MDIRDLFKIPPVVRNHFIDIRSSTNDEDQRQTNDSFSEKWKQVEENKGVQELEEFQKKWFLTLYGFSNEQALGSYLAGKKTIFDAGCGLGYKAAWFAELEPQALVIGMDFSDAAHTAASKYASIPNLYFIKGDIANTGFKPGVLDFVVCDQVIMHTEDPGKTFDHLVDILSEKGEFACYVYAKKALPRELLDDHFRNATHQISNEQLWEMSRQLTALGERLSKLKISFTAPDIPLLGIKGGEYDIQRFIYWNFLKCFWREDWSKQLCDATNFDWYSPSNAKRFSKEEFLEMGKKNQLSVIFQHTEEACHTARFGK